MALAQMGNAAGAIEQLEAALRLDAENIAAHASLGMVLGAVGPVTEEAVAHSAARVRPRARRSMRSPEC